MKLSDLAYHSKYGIVTIDDYMQLSYDDLISELEKADEKSTECIPVPAWIAKRLLTKPKISNLRKRVKPVIVTRPIE